MPNLKFTDPDYHPIWSNLSWETTPRLVVINLAKLVPKAGGAISAIIDKMWPNEDSVANLIEASEGRMKEWVNREFAAYDRKLLAALLEGVRRNLQEYVNATEATNVIQKGTWMDNCIAKFNAMQDLFTNPLDHVAALPLIREFAVAHIEILRDRSEFADEIFGPGTNKAGFATTLSKAIKDYQEYFLTRACPAVTEWRRKQIVIEEAGGIGQNPFVRLIDTGRDMKGDIYRGGKEIAEQYRAYYLNEIDVGLELNVRDVAKAWSLRDPTAPRNNSIPPDRVVWIGPVGISQWNATDNQHQFPLNAGLKNVQSPVVTVVLKYGVILDFIWVRDGGSVYDGPKRRGLMVGNDKGGTKVELKVPDGHYIRAVDTYWNYACMAIEFHYTNGASSGRYGLQDNRPAHMHRASYGEDHILRSMAIYGSGKGISEFHFGFSPDPALA